jgi:hypothetical protein
VGIGTVSPDEKLHVNGNIRLGGPQGTNEDASYYIKSAGQIHINSAADGTADNSYICLDLRAGQSGSNRSGIGICGAATSTTYQHIAFETTDTERMRIDHDGNVGIGTVSPDKKLHVYGSIQCHNTGSTGDENGLFLQSVGDWYNLSPGNDGYLHLLGGASGQGNMSGNFSSMKLAKLITYSDLDVNGDVNISSGNKVKIDGDDAVFPRITLVNGTSYSLTSGSWRKLCDFGHNFLDGAYAIKIEWNYGGTGHYWAGMATGMVPAKSYTHVQYNNAPDEPLSLNHFYHHRAVGRFEFTLDSDGYWGGSYGRIALYVKGYSTATHQFYVDVRKIL